MEYKANDYMEVEMAKCFQRGHYVYSEPPKTVEQEDDISEILSTFDDVIKQMILPAYKDKSGLIHHHELEDSKLLSLALTFLFQNHSILL